MSNKSKLILVWIITLIIQAFIFEHFKMMKKEQSKQSSMKVDSFPDHSEIPKCQNFEEHVESLLNSTED